MAPEMDVPSRRQDGVYCPNCRRADAIQAVSAVVKGGTVTHEHLDQEFAKSRSALVKELGDPPPPPLPFPCVFAIPAAFLGLGGIAACVVGPLLLYNRSDLLCLFFVALVVTYGVVFVVAITGGRWLLGLMKRARIQNEAKSRAWAGSYYCHRCDGVIIPGEDTLVSPEEFKQRMAGMHLAGN